MQRLLLLLFISITALSCGKSDNDSEPEKYKIVINHALAKTFDANLFLVNFSYTEREKMEKAIEVIKLVVATEEFRERVLNYTYNGQKSFVDNNGWSNEEIYQIILDGAETLQPARNNTMDAEIELYYANTNVIGYTYPSSTRIWINTKYFNSYSPAGVAHNLFHEWMHKQGFNHASSWSPSRDHSVPYALGFIIGEIGQDFL
ncbi:MAG: hypothetical protein ACLGHN_05515 [Bacteriovoracia bacterium]